jgi:transcriptional regulator with XRE-family HTH domain
MFKTIFINLCNEKGESPSAVCRNVGITPATFSGWTEETVPRQATLHRIANYFGVSVDYLLTGQKETPTVSDGLDDEILMLYSQLPPDKRKQADDYLRFLVQNSKKNEDT